MFFKENQLHSFIKLALSHGKIAEILKEHFQSLLAFEKPLIFFPYLYTIFKKNKNILLNIYSAMKKEQIN